MPTRKRSAASTAPTKSKSKGAKPAKKAKNVSLVQSLELDVAPIVPPNAPVPTTSYNFTPQCGVSSSSMDVIEVAAQGFSTGVQSQSGLPSSNIVSTHGFLNGIPGVPVQSHDTPNIAVSAQGGLNGVSPQSQGVATQSVIDQDAQGFGRSQGNTNNFNFFALDNCLDSHVSPNIRQKILTGTFIDLGHLLLKNPIEIDSNADVKLEYDKALGALVAKQKESIRRIYNIEHWTNAFIVYISIYVRAYPNRIHELLSYLNTIRHASERYGFPQAKNYDEQFRLRLAQNPTKPWDIVDPHLFLFTMPSAVSDQSNGPNKKAFQSAKTVGNRRKGFCHRYNDGNCQLPAQQCKFKHACESCNMPNHGKSTCRR